MVNFEVMLMAEGMPPELPPVRPVIEDETRAAYYQLISQRAQSIRDPRDRRIWELHGEGKSTREIAAVDGRSRWTVMRTLRRLAASMDAWTVMRTMRAASRDTPGASRDAKSSKVKRRGAPLAAFELEELRAIIETSGLSDPRFAPASSGAVVRAASGLPVLPGTAELIRQGLARIRGER